MSSQLVKDAIRMLQPYLAPESGIRLEQEEALLEEMAALLLSYPLAATRKAAVLGCYGLLRAALAKHRRLERLDGKPLAKRILDGDYLSGIYFRFVLDCGERALLAQLAPVYKKLQLGLAHGAAPEHVAKELFEAVRGFLDDQCGSEGGPTVDGEDEVA